MLVPEAAHALNRNFVIARFDRGSRVSKDRRVRRGRFNKGATIIERVAPMLRRRKGTVFQGCQDWVES